MVPLAGLVPLAGTPRSAIINGVLCLPFVPFPYSFEGKAFCSRKTAPTLNSDHKFVFHTKIKTALKDGFHFCG